MWKLIPVLRLGIQWPHAKCFRIIISYQIFLFSHFLLFEYSPCNTVFFFQWIDLCILPFCCYFVRFPFPFPAAYKRFATVSRINILRKFLLPYIFVCLLFTWWNTVNMHHPFLWLYTSFRFKRQFAMIFVEISFSFHCCLFTVFYTCVLPTV